MAWASAEPMRSVQSIQCSCCPLQDTLLAADAASGHFYPPFLRPWRGVDHGALIDAARWLVSSHDLHTTKKC